MKPWDVATALVLLGAAAIYAVGVARGWRRAGARHGPRWWTVGAYAAGLATLVLALLSPLDTLADVLFSAHMGQHELLMLVAAPLLVMGRPLSVALAALPARARAAVIAAVERPGLRRGWRALTHPAFVLALHAAALWLWHVPAFFEEALAHETVHAFQHLAFFLTAALFWWTLVHGRYGRLGYGAAAAFVFLTGLHSGLLGAMLTFARAAIYPTHAARTRTIGRDPVEDQTLAGLLMWIPAGVLLTVLGLAFLSAWLGEAERRDRRRALSG